MNKLPSLFSRSRKNHNRKITPKQEKNAEARRKIEKYYDDKLLKELEEGL